jgi:thiamine phosphate synthase YjbQ (UPF0047 family)
MEIKTVEIEFSTKGKTEILDITPKVDQVLADSGLNEVHVILFTIGSTSGIITI